MRGWSGTSILSPLKRAVRGFDCRITENRRGRPVGVVELFFAGALSEPLISSVSNPPDNLDADKIVTVKPPRLSFRDVPDHDFELAGRTRSFRRMEKDVQRLINRQVPDDDGVLFDQQAGPVARGITQF